MGTSKGKKRQGWEALSHNAPHILRELQLHFKVSTSRLIFISLPICSALWDNYAISKNRGLSTLSNSIYSKIRHLLRQRPRPTLGHPSNNVCEKHAHLPWSQRFFVIFSPLEMIKPRSGDRYLKRGKNHEKPLGPG